VSSILRLIVIFVAIVVVVVAAAGAVASIAAGASARPVDSGSHNPGTVIRFQWAILFVRPAGPPAFCGGRRAASAAPAATSRLRLASPNSVMQYLAFIKGSSCEPVALLMNGAGRHFLGQPLAAAAIDWRSGAPLPADCDKSGRPVVGSRRADFLGRARPRRRRPSHERPEEARSGRRRRWPFTRVSRPAAWRGC
jgi:hypothetical protein